MQSGFLVVAGANWIQFQFNLSATGVDPILEYEGGGGSGGGGGTLGADPCSGFVIRECAFAISNEFIEKCCAFHFLARYCVQTFLISCIVLGSRMWPGYNRKSAPSECSAFHFRFEKCRTLSLNLNWGEEKKFWFASDSASFSTILRKKLNLSKWRRFSLGKEEFCILLVIISGETMAHSDLLSQWILLVQN